MNEDFLHFLWRTRCFDHFGLRTTENEPVEIIHPGEHNTNAGPDFSNAKLKIGETLWAGNVEMHLKSNEWLQHKHQHNPAYDNVILHVVLEEDQPAFNTSGRRIPCLEMRRRIPPRLDGLYKKLLNNEHWIPCQHFFHEVPMMTKSLWLDRMLVERLERKTETIRQALEANGNDWEETFYQFFARNFGFSVNADPFEALARSLPQRILASHRDNLLQIEALLFGQAGLLEQDFEEEYPKALQKEFLFLKHKFNLTPLNPASWKFLRLHPGNFPTLRLAQFAKVVEKSHHLFSKVLDVTDHESVEALLEAQLDGYWLTHYTFGNESKQKQKSLGKDAVRLLTINTVVPFLFVYGKIKREDDYKDKALRLLEELPSEKNKIISSWGELGMEADSAYVSQALLQLKNEWCGKHKCLSCGVGAAILKD